MADDKLLDNKACLYRLAETRVVCDKQIDARHVNGTNERIKLIVFYGYAASERRQKIITIYVCGYTPADGIQKGIKAAVRIMALDLRQSGFFQNPSPWLNLPDHSYLLAVGIFFD